MANSRQAKKRIRQTVKRTERNKARRSRIRTYVKMVHEAIAGGNAPDAMAALRKAQSELDRGVTKGVVRRNTAARTVARLNARIKAFAVSS